MMDHLENDDSDSVWQTKNIYKRCWQQHCGIIAWIKEHYKTQDFTEWCQQMADYHLYMSRYMSWLRYMAATQMFAYDPQEVCSCVGDDAQKPSKQRSRSSKAARRKRRRRSRVAKKRNSSSVEFHIANVDMSCDADLDIGDSAEQVEFEFEMTKELEEFFAQTAKHRQQRELLKTAQALLTNENTVEHVDVTNLSVSRGRPTVLPPSEQVGSRRLAEMRQLYGVGAAMIHGMETAMQLSFDRNIDRYKPRLWPAVPLNIVFD